MDRIILTNGNLFSFKKKNRCEDTILIENGRFTQIGRADDILSTASDETNVVNLQQAIVLPGFIDSHIHLLSYGLSLQRVDVSNTTKEECLARVSHKASEMPEGQWIIGHGWDHNHWPKGYPTRKDLDAISQQHPIYLTHKSLHCGWANSTALKITAIQKGRPNPAGGTIMKDESGVPNGILLENAMKLVSDAVPVPDEKQVTSALKTAQKKLNAFGITAVHDFDPWHIFTVLNVMRENKDLSLRVTKSIPETSLNQAIEAGLRSGAGNDWVRVGWLKLFADGALGSQTAAMIQPYLGSENYGMLLLDIDDILEYGEKALKAGIAMAVHAIGDKANQTVLDAYEALAKNDYFNRPTLPSRVEHAQLLREEDIHRFAALGITPSMQPIHAVSDMEMAEAYWGQRCETAYAWRSLLDADANLIFGSDGPVETPNPMQGIAAAISRQKMTTQTGQLAEGTWTSHQCVSLTDALTAYCNSPSHVSGFKNITGRINPGYCADLVLLHNDFLNSSPVEIYQTRPLAVMMDGNWVYKNDKIDLEYIK